MISILHRTKYRQHVFTACHSATLPITLQDFFADGTIIARLNFFLQLPIYNSRIMDVKIIII